MICSGSYSQIRNFHKSNKYPKTTFHINIFLTLEGAQDHLEVWYNGWPKKLWLKNRLLNFIEGFLSNWEFQVRNGSKRSYSRRGNPSVEYDISDSFQRKNQHHQIPDSVNWWLPLCWWFPYYLQTPKYAQHQLQQCSKNLSNGQS